MTRTGRLSVGRTPFVLLAAGILLILVAALSLVGSGSSGDSPPGQPALGHIKLLDAPYKRLSSSAFGLDVTVLSLLRVGPLGAVSAPPNASSSIPVSLNVLGVISGTVSLINTSATTGSPANHADASASLTKVNLTLVDVGITADVISSTCDTNASSPNVTSTGSGKIVNLKIGGIKVTASGQLNLGLLGIVTVAIDQQIPPANATTSITVNEVVVSVQLLGTTTSVVLSSVTCDP